MVARSYEIQNALAVRVQAHTELSAEQQDLLRWLDVLLNIDIMQPLPVGPRASSQPMSAIQRLVTSARRAPFEDRIRKMHITLALYRGVLGYSRQFKILL